ncbi:glycoside hydrolase family 3 N-terminal domain-containing protein, partial [Streptococcus suis]
GKLASAVIQKASEQGVYTYLKHFALNDQETNRQRVATWSNEQAIREIYLKAFEVPVKEGKAPGVMSSFNRVGTTWTGASYELLTTVLREEWGFVGTVITDG